MMFHSEFFHLRHIDVTTDILDIQEVHARTTLHITRDRQMSLYHCTKAGPFPTKSLTFHANTIARKKADMILHRTFFVMRMKPSTLHIAH